MRASLFRRHAFLVLGFPTIPIITIIVRVMGLFLHSLPHAGRVWFILTTVRRWYPFTSSNGRVVVNLVRFAALTAVISLPTISLSLFPVTGRNVFAAFSLSTPVVLQLPVTRLIRTCSFMTI